MKLKIFFSSSACAYNKSKQQDVFVEGLKEIDAYPADPEDGYGWKNYLVRECVDILWKIMGLKELPGTIIFTALLGLMMEVEKKPQQLGRLLTPKKMMRK